MENGLKQRKQLRKIILYEGDPIITEADIKTISNLLQSDSKFLTVGDTIVNKSNIKQVVNYEVDDMESQIISQPRLIQNELRLILKERNDKGFQTNGFAHLRRIYESRRDLKKVEDN